MVTKRVGISMSYKRSTLSFGWRLISIHEESDKEKTREGSTRAGRRTGIDGLFVALEEGPGI